MRAAFLFLLSFAGMQRADAQLFRFNPVADTAKTVSLEGYADVYYAFDLAQPSPADRPYFVSHHRHNEVAINLAYLSLRYTAPRARAVFTPGFGTYMNANYAAERVTLRNIVEASVGVRLSPRRALWLDAGVLPSPYTPETPISFDQPTLTRSFAPEYVPYYLAGARLSAPLGRRVLAAAYLLNGWQQIEDVNTPLAFGSSIEWRPDSALLLVANTYAGNERSAAAPLQRTRYLLDAYAVWKPTKRLTVTAGAYAGWQSRADSSGGPYRHVRWGQATAVARWAWNARSSASVRAEVFTDPGSVMILPITRATVPGLEGFQCFSASGGYNLYATPHILIRAEARYFRAADPVFLREGRAAADNFVFTGGMAAKF